MNRSKESGWRCALIGGWTAVVMLSLSSHAATATTQAQRKLQAEQLVREALHREIYGQQQERDQLLALAAELHPDRDFAAARWHQGYVHENGQWVRADRFPAFLDSQRRVTEYRQIRDQYPATIDGQWALAEWCGRRGLEQRERAHLNQVVLMDPNHIAARQRLGFVRVGLDWVQQNQLNEASEQLADFRARRDQWRPQIETLAAGLSSTRLNRREYAVGALRAITDPAAAGAIEAVLWNRNAQAAGEMVAALAAMPAGDVTMILARQAVASPFSAVRQAAALQLQSRALEDYVPAMLALMYTPAETTTETRVLSNGSILLRLTLQREGQDEREMLVQDTAFSGSPSIDTISASNLLRAEAATREREFQQSLGVVQRNLATQALNQRIVQTLNIATDQQLPAEPRVWWQWWNEVNEVFTAGDKRIKGVRMAEQLVRLERSEDLLPRRFNPEPSNPTEPPPSPSPPPRRMDCLAAGTPVWTDQGPLAIESVRVGDLVLAQDSKTGQLAYQPVTRTTVRPSGRLVRVHLANGERFETSGGHLFWCAGDGWMRARELRSGMELHGVSGTVRVSDVEDGPVQETYNLIVDGFHTYFAGTAGTLCHDNSVRRRTEAAVPGLLPR